MRLFSDQAKTETERGFHVQHGWQAYLLPPDRYLGRHAHNHRQDVRTRARLTQALYACVGLLAVEKSTPQDCWFIHRYGPAGRSERQVYRDKRPRVSRGDERLAVGTPLRASAATNELYGRKRLKVYGTIPWKV
jgi:hypothetical protein